MILDAKMHKIYVYKIYGYDNGFQQLCLEISPTDGK